MTIASLLPVRMDILVSRATDNDILVRFANPLTDVPYDITGDTVTFTARDGFGPNATLLVSKTLTPTTPAQGLTGLTLTRTDLADVPNAARAFKDFKYEIRRKLASGGAESVWFAGDFKLHGTAPPPP